MRITTIDTPEAVATAAVGKGSASSDIVKLTVWEAPVLPAKSLAYKVKLCGPMGNSVRVQFPVIVMLSFPSKLYDTSEVSSLTVKFNGVFIAVYVAFSINRRFIVGGVESSGIVEPNVVVFESIVK